MAGYDYDLVVIGAGAAGSDAAGTAREQGKTVCMIEEDKLGGTCLNYGCDPTKALLKVAALLHESQHGQRYGVMAEGARLDWGQVQRHVQGGITITRGGTYEEAMKNLREQGIEVIEGHGELRTAHSVSVGGREVSGEHILLANGCETVPPEIEGLRDAGYITNKEAVSLEKLPQRMGILGGGPIGLEFAQMFQRFGVQVTLFEQKEELLPREEPELAQQLRAILEGEGVRIETGVDIERVEVDASGAKRVVLTRAGGQTQIEMDQLLVASGRRPNVKGVGLEEVGIELTEKGGVKVDETLRTSVPSIWAVGDVLGGYQFTHVASEQGRFVVGNMFGREAQAFEYPPMPWVTYTDPPLAHVGETEQELQKRGAKYRGRTFEVGQVARAIANDRREGAIKVLATPDGIVLGAHLLANGADEMLALFVLAMNEKIPLQRLATLMLAYPTLAEAVRWSADAWVKEAGQSA